MQVTIEDQMYYVYWQYTLVDNTIKTTCAIKLRDEIISQATITKHHKTQHCKDVARKYSLTAAMKKAGFTKNQRFQFWQTYLNRKTIPQPQPQAVVA